MAGKVCLLLAPSRQQLGMAGKVA